MRLLNKNLLVERIVATQSTGGILFPGTMTDDINTGGAKLFRVIAAAEDCECIPGDRVICGSYTEGVRVMEDGRCIISENYVLLRLPINPQPDNQNP